MISEIEYEPAHSTEETVPVISIASNSDAQVDEDSFLLDGEVNDIYSDIATSSDADSELLQETELLDGVLLETSLHEDYICERTNRELTLKVLR